MSDEWKPNKELANWAREHFTNMSVGGIWMPEGSGVTYQKSDEKTWNLIRIVDTDEARDNHNRMKVLMFDIGVKITEEDSEVVPMPVSSEDAMVQELEMKRKIAESWTDIDGTPLKEMNLENTYPSFAEDREILLNDGNTTNIEIWEYKILNPNSQKYIAIDPDDYHLLMGDGMFMRYRNSLNETYRAMTRGEIVEAADSGNLGRVVGSKCPSSGEKIPPWMYGTYCEVIDDGEEE